MAATWHPEQRRSLHEVEVPGCDDAADHVFGHDVAHALLHVACRT